eukprot:Awhi_evm3s5673
MYVVYHEGNLHPYEILQQQRHKRNKYNKSRQLSLNEHECEVFRHQHKMIFHEHHTSQNRSIYMLLGIASQKGYVLLWKKTVQVYSVSQTPEQYKSKTFEVR